MNVHAQSPERREIQAAARRYRRNGYKVSGPDRLAAMPGFLGDLVPDLIAERDDDRVIIEVKRAATVPGSNDIVELAERVSRQPGWRFELIAVPSAVEIGMPDIAGGITEIRRLLDEGFLKPAFVVVYAMIENLVAAAVARSDRKRDNVGLPALIRDLTVLGVIDEDTRHRVDEARAVRNAIVRSPDAAAPTRGNVEALISLAQDLQREVSAGSDT